MVNFDNTLDTKGGRIMKMEHWIRAIAVQWYWVLWPWANSTTQTGSS